MKASERLRALEHYAAKMNRSFGVARAALAKVRGEAE